MSRCASCDGCPRRWHCPICGATDLSRTRLERARHKAACERIALALLVRAPYTKPLPT